MKIQKTLRKLLKTYSAENIVYDLITVMGHEQVMQIFCNRCVFKSYAEKKNQSKAWYRAARIFHRALDEIKLDKEAKSIFKVSRRDVYECQKCKKRFRVDAATEKNCKYEIDKNAFVAKCPGCGKAEL